MYIYNPRDVGVRTVTSLWLTGLKPSSRFNETPCLEWMKLREIEKDTQRHPLASSHTLTSMNILQKTLHTHGVPTECEASMWKQQRCNLKLLILGAYFNVMHTWKSAMDHSPCNAMLGGLSRPSTSLPFLI